MARYRHRTTSVLVRINPKTEPEIYRRIMSVDNKAGYIKSLVLRDVMSERENTAKKDKEKR